MNTPAKRKFWGIIQKYEPFRMGGSLNNWYRFPVQGEEVKLLKFHGFVGQMDDEWSVYELVSGGKMCSGKSKREAVEAARELIKITPDFAIQIKQLGKALDKPEITLEEATRLSKLATDPNPAEQLK